MTLAKTIFVSLVITLFLSSCSDYSPDHKGFTALEQIKREGKINVFTRSHPTTYYESTEGLTGLEFDLIMLFAKKLGVKVNFILPDSFADILSGISSNKADIAAAGLTVTDEREKTMRFATIYQDITEQVIYRSGNKRPKKVEDLSKGILEVAGGTSHIESLNIVKKEYPELTWLVNSELTTDALMYLVNEGLIDYTVSDSHQASSLKKYYPKLHSAFNVSKKRELAWALPMSTDNSLYDEVNLFFAEIKQNKKLTHLLDKYYGDAKNLGYVDNCTFRRHMEARLPSFRSLFKKEAAKQGLDWRLLAAVGYQESHWDPKAVSSTGVKGIMMLTNDTAKFVGVADRVNSAQSIRGGALYLKQKIEQIPSRIQEPDRTLLALASYNVGYGHLEDARIITKSRGLDPDKWIDVKHSLPLLTKKRWYSKTKYGYARGKEPVRYVENIRGYYKLLAWLTEENKIEQSAMTPVQDKDESSQSTIN